MGKTASPKGCQLRSRQPEQKANGQGQPKCANNSGSRWEIEQIGTYDTRDTGEKAANPSDGQAPADALRKQNSANGRHDQKREYEQHAGKFRGTGYDNAESSVKEKIPDPNAHPRSKRLLRMLRDSQ